MNIYIFFLLKFVKDRYFSVCKSFAFHGKKPKKKKKWKIDKNEFIYKSHNTFYIAENKMFILNIYSTNRKRMRGP